MQKINPIVLLVIGLILTKGTSFLENLILAYVYGTSATSDAFILSLTLPNIVFAVISTAIAQCYVPIYQKKYEKQIKLGKQYTYGLMLILAIISIFISIFIYISIPLIIKILAPSASKDVVAIACKLMKSMSWVALIVFEMGVLQGYFQMIKKYFIVGIISVPLNIGLTITLLIGTHSLTYFNIGIFFSYILQFILFFLIAWKNGLKINHLNINKEILKSIRDTLILMFPLFLGGILNDLSAVIDKSFASSFPTGVLSGMDYGNKVSGIIYAIISVPIITIFYPNLSKLVSENRDIESIYLLKKTCFYTLFFLLPIIVTTIIFSKEICTILFLRGNFTQKSLEITSNSLILYTISIIPMNIRNLFEKIFFSHSNTIFPMKNTIVMLISNIIGNIILSIFLGYRGLIISTIISFVISVLYMYVSMKNNYKIEINENEIRKLIRLSITTLLLVVVNRLVTNFFEISAFNKIVQCIVIVAHFSITFILYFLLLKSQNLISTKKIILFIKEFR